MTADREIGVAVVGFGWMGQVHSRAWARLAHALSRTLRCGRGSWPSPTPTRAAGSRRGDAYGFADAVADWARAAGARRPRRGERLRPQLRAPRGGARGRASRVVTCGSRSRPAAAPTTRRRSRPPSGRRGRDVGGRVQLPQRPGRRARARARGRRAARPARVGGRPDARRLLRTSRRRPVVALRPGVRRHRACSATWPATASTWRSTSAATGLGGDRRAGRRPGDVHHRAPGRRPAPCRTTRAAATDRAAPSATRTSPRHCCGSARVRAARSRRRGSRSGSSAATGSTYAGPTVRCRGTSGGWASSASASAQDYLDAPWETRFVAGRRRRPRRLPAGLGHGHGLRRPEGRSSAARLVESIHTGKPHGATIDDAVVAAELVDAMVRSYEERRWVTP